MTMLLNKLHRFCVAAVAVVVASSMARADADPGDALRVPAPSVTQAPVAALRVVVPCAAGSPGDLFARAVARLLSERSGQHVAVENVRSSEGPVAEATEAAHSNTIYLLTAGAGDASACGE